MLPPGREEPAALLAIPDIRHRPMLRVSRTSLPFARARAFRPSPGETLMVGDGVAISCPQIGEESLLLRPAPSQCAGGDAGLLALQQDRPGMDPWPGRLAAHGRRRESSIRGSLRHRLVFHASC